MYRLRTFSLRILILSALVNSEESPCSIVEVQGYRLTKVGPTAMFLMMFPISVLRLP